MYQRCTGFLRVHAHAADRILRVPFGGSRCRRLLAQVLRGIGLEFVPTALAAEMVGNPIVYQRCTGFLRIDAHAADWILRVCGGRSRRGARLAQILSRVGLKLVATTRAAEVIGRAVVISRRTGGLGVHLHPADGISRRIPAGMRGSGRFRQVLSRIGPEFPEATLAAKVIGDALVLAGSRCLGGIDCHTADGVF